ncbi:sulfotransferase domain-containing protein [Oscillatoriales cyanobacterium LEGE 11467]|uniref:Sulfotransferase domain-containing protein n=1 Tax=Zarconia navalis LEGE 11467 TaxID=1828826 RepID=A0A928Z6W3_9CYAN|nr:sulfotransferase domain-containing protein [Zarconia navalis]MBE9040822.1 sulfotransferase domain-containing protein [Zarconia navalis LEGE 11467]
MPDFLIIGAQKCGTTSLYCYLAQHPQIITVPHKEVHFFDLNYDRGLDWYGAHFPPSGLPGAIAGEASPYYLFHPQVPARVYQHFPQIKLIVLLRNPVDRALSQYHHEVKLGFEQLPLEEAIAREPERLQGEVEKLSTDPTYYSYNHQHYTYLSRGRYLEQLQRWRIYFPPEQFLILKTEDLHDRPDETLARVLAFLQLPIVDLPTYLSYNAGSYPRAIESVKQDLTDYFREPNQQLWKYLQQDFDWQ